MPLKLIHGPPNSGRAGLVRERFAEAIGRGPILVVPTVDDVYAFERELCQAGAVVGGAVMTFSGLFEAVAGAAGSPPPLRLTNAQRLGAISAAVAGRRERLGPLRRSAARPGFARSFDRLLHELQAAGLEPEAVAAGAATLEGSSYLADISQLFQAYVDRRDHLGRVDEHGVASQALAVLEAGDAAWGRPVFLYGLDDLTGNQLELVRHLARAAEVTVALPYEAGNEALAARVSLLEKLRTLGVEEETRTPPNPANTDNPLLFHLERGFGRAQAQRRPPADGLLFLRSAGERAEAEAIASEVARLIAAGIDAAEIAIVLRDPGRRGPLLASVLESYGVATALEAEIPVSGTSVGGTLIALLQAEFGTRRAADLLRFLRGPSGVGPAKVDWFERAVRRRRLVGAGAALELWEARNGEAPRDLAELRRAAGGGPAELSAEIARLAQTMASRPLRTDGDGPAPGRGDGLELRAAAAIANALRERAELEGLSPEPGDAVEVLEDLQLRAWSGPVEGRVRIASPYRLRAARFDHVFVGSLQDGEFPRHDGGGDPFLSDSQRATLGLEPRRDTEAEERYLFHSCLALARRSLALSYRDSDENGVAASRSPLLDDVRRLLEPPPGGSPDPVEETRTRGRDLAQVVHRVAEAPSEAELARAIATHGTAADPAAMLGAACASPEVACRVTRRLSDARLAERVSRAPGPLSNPAAIGSLAGVSAYGGTTLEQFDVCSYRWFVGHELKPVRLDPEPDALVQGTLMHAALQGLYEERPGGDAVPRPASLPAWIERGRQLLKALAAERELGSHPAERTIQRRVEGLLARFLADEAGRDPGPFEPWEQEARFGEGEEASRPTLEIDGWGLHGAIDRIDRDSAGRAVVIDYKLARDVTRCAKLEEEAKLQLQLYLTAVSELWGMRPVAGLYFPLRGTSSRQPRGLVLDQAGDDLDRYGLVRTDRLDAGEFEALLGDARRRSDEIVARMRRGDIRRDPGPREGLPGHDACPAYCEFATICRRDRAPVEPPDEEGEEQ
jgi:ATP-dependent helicase/DNAse subunit B